MLFRSMNNQLIGLDVLLFASVLNQPFCQSSKFTLGDHPADNITTEDVHDHIKIKVGPLDRPFELGYIPGPNLVRFCCQQLRLDIVGPLHLPSAFFDTPMLGCKESIHGANRAMVIAFI